MRRLAVLLPLILILAACAIEDPPADTGDPSTLGQRTFASWCAPCHGTSGEGFINALDAPALNDTGEAYLLTDAEILAAIIDGGAESGSAMTPLGDLLTEEQQTAVLYYVHTLWTAEQQAAHEAAGGHIPPPTVPPPTAAPATNQP